jgi:hypothetical protein
MKIYDEDNKTNTFVIVDGDEIVIQTESSVLRDSYPTIRLPWYIARSAAFAIVGLTDKLMEKDMTTTASGLLCWRDDLLKANQKTR